MTDQEIIDSLDPKAQNFLTKPSTDQTRLQLSGIDELFVWRCTECNNQCTLVTANPLIPANHCVNMDSDIYAVWIEQHLPKSLQHG